MAIIYSKVYSVAAVIPGDVTFASRHFGDGGLLPPPAYLAITRLDPEEGYYLIYYDALGNEMTDTYHESAKDQAAFEFGDRLAWKPLREFPNLCEKIGQESGE